MHWLIPFKQQTVIGTKVGSENEKGLCNRLNFETYNLGHLMMAGIVHRRATENNSFLMLKSLRIFFATFMRFCFCRTGS